MTSYTIKQIADDETIARKAAIAVAEIAGRDLDSLWRVCYVTRPESDLTKDLNRLRAEVGAFLMACNIKRGN